MCDYSGKLVAWMDGELPKGEAADVERHLRRVRRMPRTSGGVRASEQHVRGLLSGDVGSGSTAIECATLGGRCCVAGAIAVAAAIAALLMVPRQRMAALRLPQARFTRRCRRRIRRMLWYPRKPSLTLKQHSVRRAPRKECAIDTLHRARELRIPGMKRA